MCEFSTLSASLSLITAHFSNKTCVVMFESWFVRNCVVVFLSNLFVIFLIADYHPAIVQIMTQFTGAGRSTLRRMVGYKGNDADSAIHIELFMSQMVMWESHGQWYTVICNDSTFVFQRCHPIQLFLSRKLHNELQGLLLPLVHLRIFYQFWSFTYLQWQNKICRIPDLFQL